MQDSINDAIPLLANILPKINMQTKIKLIEFLKELSEYSKDYSDGFLAPKECKVKLSDLNKYDFFIAKELENTKRELWRESNGFSEEIKITYTPVIKIENDNLSFIPRIVREYLNEIES